MLNDKKAGAGCTSRAFKHPGHDVTAPDVWPSILTDYTYDSELDNADGVPLAFRRSSMFPEGNNSINSLYVNGVINIIIIILIILIIIVIINTSTKIISSEIFQFYSSLYSSSFSESDCNIFFNNIHSSIPQLEQETKDLCEADIKIEEVDKAINKLCSGKSPDPDGLTCEFYKYFREDLRELLFKAFFECIQDNFLSSTMKQVLITLIPKPGKDTRHIDNLHPSLYLTVIIQF